MLLNWGWLVRYADSQADSSSGDPVPCLRHGVDTPEACA